MQATSVSAPEDVVTGRIRIAVEPAKLVAGETKEAWVTVDVDTFDGAPADVGLPVLTTSAGQIDRPTRTGPGRFRARLRPPVEAFPHVAVVTATVDDGGPSTVGFFGVRLWGRGQTSVKTRPGARVTVRVGADAFGPVTAGADGNAAVPIVVPPGPEHAVATSVDALGNESTKTIDLAVPAFNRVALRMLDDVCVTGGVARALVLAVDKKGAPLVDARLVFSVDGVAQALRPRPLSPGLYLYAWTATPGRSGVARVEVALADAPVSRAAAEVRVLSGAPVRATVSLSTSRLTADDARSVAVRVAVFDAAGAPLPPGAARVVVDTGYLDGATSNAAERAMVWVVPAKTASTTATLQVRAPGGAVIGSARLALARGQASRLAFAAVEGIAADGRSGVDIDLSAFDAAGNEIDPRGIVVTAASGALYGARVDERTQRYRARFVPDAAREPGVAVVDARLGSASARLAVPVFAAPRPTLLVAPFFTSSWGFGGVTSVGGEVSLLVRLPAFDGAVYVGVDAGALAGIGPAATASSLRLVPVLAEAAWRPVLPLGLGTTAGAHVGAQTGVVVVDVNADAKHVVAPSAVATAVLGGFVDVGPGSVDVAVRLPLGAPLGARLPGFSAPPFGPGVVVGYRLGF